MPDMSERSLQRWLDCYEADGAEGHYDHRLGCVSARRAPVEGVAEHNVERSYNWVRLTMQAYGRMRRRRALPGVMVHQVGSRHKWVPDRWWHPIVTMDDAASEPRHPHADTQYCEAKV